MSEIRCIGPNGEQVGIVRTRDALRKAEELGMDLVEIASQAKPPVCRIMDYGKYKYEQDKKKKDARKKQTFTKLKEVKFHANVEDHDYNTKIRHAREFLEDGHRVKFSLFYRGRENAHRELGLELMDRVQKDLENDGVVDQPPRMMGRNLFMHMTPKQAKD